MVPVKSRVPVRIAAGAILLATFALMPVASAKSFNDFKFPPATSFPPADSLTYEIRVKGAKPPVLKPGEKPAKVHNGEGTITTKLLTKGPYRKLEVLYSGTEPTGEELGYLAYMDAATLKPWGFTRHVTTTTGTQTLELTFDKGQIHQQVTGPGSVKSSREITNSGQFLLMPLLFLAGRGLVFEEGNLFTSLLLNPDSLSLQTPIITISGKEVVPVPAGIYECWKVEYKLGQNTEWGYYAVKNPRLVVKYETSTREWLLKKHNLPDPNKPKAKPRPKPKPTVINPDAGKGPGPWK